MKSFWQFLNLIENTTPKDYLLGELNITCFHNKLKALFKEDFASILKINRTLNKEELDHIKSLDLDKYLDLNGVSMQNSISELTDVIFSLRGGFSASRCLGLMKITIVTTPSAIEQTFEEHVVWYKNKKTPYPERLAKEDIFENILSYVNDLSIKNRTLVHEYLLQCREAEQVDWRPTEAVPEDYYAL